MAQQNPTSDTISRQSTGVLLQLVMHIREADLGTPLQITPPSVEQPYFSLVVTSSSLEAWLASHLVEVVGDEEVRRSENGHHVITTTTVRFAGMIPVRLVAARRVLQAVTA